jgi:putative NADH-flavin reductase
MTQKAIIVRRYKNDAEYQKDANKLLAKGYEVQNVVSEVQRSGCGRFIALGGIGALIFKPKPVQVVTYRLRAG